MQLGRFISQATGALGGGAWKDFLLRKNGHGPGGFGTVNGRRRFGPHGPGSGERTTAGPPAVARLRTASLLGAQHRCHRQAARPAGRDERTEEGHCQCAGHDQDHASDVDDPDVHDES